MLSELASIFELYREAILAVSDGKAIYMNAAARRLFPSGLRGDALFAVFPHEHLESEAEVFACTVNIRGTDMSAVISSFDGAKLISLLLPETQRDEFPAVPLDRAGIAMKNAMSVLNMASALISRQIEGEGNADLSRYCAMLSHSYHSLLRITENFAQVCGGLSVDIHPSVFDLAELCSELINTVACLTSGRGIDMSFHTTLSQLRIYGDPNGIERMLSNLLSNSLKNTDRGGRIVLSLTESSGCAILTVSDTGCGIRPEIMTTLFNRYTAPAESNEEHPGAGLGLSIVRQTAAMYGGSVMAESRPGNGTRVTVRLPVTSPEAAGFKTQVKEYESRGLSTVLTELSDVLGYDCYFARYMD
ncbi:MAG: sensor histidine kinase [Clostridia bacterium]|nr:sensor histidine kinase [Clostridia bacterium]